METLVSEVGATLVFNTGRHYGVPQALKCKVMSNELEGDGVTEMYLTTVAFVDESRNLSGLMTMSCWFNDDATQSEILGFYDAGRYECISMELEEELRAL